MCILVRYQLQCFVFFFKQKTAYEMRISDWSSDVCSSDLGAPQDEGEFAELAGLELEGAADRDPVLVAVDRDSYPRHLDEDHQEDRAEQHRVGQRPVDRKSVV